MEAKESQAFFADERFRQKGTLLRWLNKKQEILPLLVPTETILGHSKDRDKV